MDWVGDRSETNLVSGSVLSSGDEKVDVIRSDKVLSETDDGSGERDLSVMVGGLFGDESSELGNLQASGKRVNSVLPFETSGLELTLISPFSFLR